MATRAANLSQLHVEALNAVPVEFYGTGRKLKAINDTWKLYLDHHTIEGPLTEVWAQKKQDLFMELLYLMSQFLGYNFSKAQIKSDIYLPRAHGDLETDQAIIRQGVVALLKGEITLPIAVKDFPVTKLNLDVQAAIQKLQASVSET